MSLLLRDPRVGVSWRHCPDPLKCCQPRYLYQPLREMQETHLKQAAAVMADLCGKHLPGPFPYMSSHTSPTLPSTLAPAHAPLLPVYQGAWLANMHLIFKWYS